MGWLAKARQSTVGKFSARLIRRFRATHVPMLAAALAYYAAFSLGPLLLLLGGWLGVFLRTRPDLANHYQTVIHELVNQVLPLQENGAELIAQSFDLIVGQLSEGAILRSVVSLVILIWAASGFFTSLQVALEVIFDVEKMRGFLHRRAVALGLVVIVALVIAIDIIGVAAISSISRLTQVFTENVPVPQVPPQPFLPAWLESVLLSSGVTALVFTLTFRFLPKGGSTWGAALTGALVSSVSMALVRWVLVSTFDVDRLNLIYGVITGLVVTLLWLYLGLLLFLIGALVSAEMTSTQRRNRLRKS